MDGLTWIHADAERNELRELLDVIAVDSEISQKAGAELIDNTFSFTVSEKTWLAQPILKGHFIYSPGTEWGGQVNYIKHSTLARAVEVRGVNWRGLLYQRRIMPPDGYAYLSFRNEDARNVLRAVVGDAFGTLVKVAAGQCGYGVSADFRYQSIAQGIQTAFRNYGLRLVIVYDSADQAVILDAVPANSLESVIELSQDYGVQLTSTDGNEQEANHCLALGAGELTERAVMDVYRVGQNFYTTKPASLEDEDIRTIVLDYPNAESTDDLIASAIAKLQEVAPAQKIIIDELTIHVDAHLGDRLGVRDRLTGLSNVSEVTGKILTVSGGQTAVSMTVDTIGTTIKDAYTWGDMADITWNTASAYTWEHYGG